jgi:hypothetical protein
LIKTVRIISESSLLTVHTPDFPVRSTASQFSMQLAQY